MPKGIKGFQKGHPKFGNGSNKGKHWKVKDTSKMSKSHIGNKNSLGKKYGLDVRIKMSKAHNHLWKGEGACYYVIHNWVQRWKGKAKFCENCGIIGEKIGDRWNIDWANIDHKYRRVLEDYIGLCKKCHRKYDK